MLRSILTIFKELLHINKASFSWPLLIFNNGTNFMLKI